MQRTHKLINADPKTLELDKDAPRRSMQRLVRHGRRKPYTEIGIARLPCYRCGERSEYQWQVCADDRLYRPLCASCDVKLNRMVLRWMGDPEAEIKVAKYAKSRLPNVQGDGSPSRDSNEETK